MKFKNLIFFLLIQFSFQNLFAQADSSSLVYLSSPKLSLSSYQYKKELKPLSLSMHKEPEIKYDPLETKINYKTLAGLGVVYLAAGIGVHIYQNNSWWAGKKTHFHFQNDWKYALWLDKVGHFYAAQLLSHAFSSGLEAGNIQADDAAFWGSVGALAFQLYVEVEDGFGPEWGFSPGDAGSNVLGATYVWAQYHYPVLKNFQFKYSYYPSKKLEEGLHKGIIDDYEGEKYWLSFRMKNLLPESISNYWPSFLNIALGMGVKNLDGRGGGQRELYIGLDFDSESIPLYGKGWQFIKNTLNYFHFPMPGIRITPNAAFFIFLF